MCCLHCICVHTHTSQFGVLVGLGTALQQELARMVHQVHEVRPGDRVCGVVFSHDCYLVPVAVVLTSHQRAAHSQLITQDLQEQCESELLWKHRVNQA